MDTSTLSGKVVLVCGAGLEIGRAVSMGFVHYGASLALQGYSPIHLDTTLKQVRDSGAIGEDYVFDISKKISAQVMLDQVKNRFGSIDILVNIPAASPQKPILDMDEWDWQRALEMNVNAAYLMTQLVGREMSDHGGGAIIHVIGRRIDQKSASPAYAAGMAAIAGFVQASASELSKQNIRIFTVNTDLDTSLAQPAAAEALSSQLGDLDHDVNRRIQCVVSWVLFLSIQAAGLPVGEPVYSSWGISLCR